MKLIYRRLVCALLPYPKPCKKRVSQFTHSNTAYYFLWSHGVGYLQISATCKSHLQKNSFCFLKKPFFFGEKKQNKAYHSNINQVCFITEDNSSSLHTPQHSCLFKILTKLQIIQSVLKGNMVLVKTSLDKIIIQQHRWFVSLSFFVCV